MNYKSTRWRRKQAYILARDKYQCQEAKRYGRSEEATTVHHIWPADQYPEFAWEDWNLIGLSTKNHDAMHNRKTRELTAKGLEWKSRTIPPEKKL